MYASTAQRAENYTFLKWGGYYILKHIIRKLYYLMKIDKNVK